MFSIAFDKEAQKEFLSLDRPSQKLLSDKIIQLKNGDFTQDKPLQGKHKGKFRKRAGNYRIIYLKENNLLIITIIRVAHRKKVY